MTEAKMLSLFDLIQDKANDPLFLDSEKYELLNDAQTDYVNQFLGLDDGGGKEKPPKIGLNDIVDSALKPLLIATQMTTSATGLLTTAAVKAETTEDPIMIVNIWTSANWPVNYVRQQDIPYITAMEFSAPTTDYPIYSINSLGWQLYPKETISDLNVFILKSPKEIASTIDCELPAFTHNKIVAMALQKTGLVTEDEALAMVENVTSG